MNLYEDCLFAHEKDKRKRLRKLKRNLWICGAKPKYWEYLYQDGEWKAFHCVSDMDIIAYMVLHVEGGDYLKYRVSYTENGERRNESFTYLSDLKRFVGEKIAENSEVVW